MKKGNTASAGERDREVCGEFLHGRDRPATQTLVAFIDEHRDLFGGASIQSAACYRARLQDPPSKLLRPQAPCAPSARTVHTIELKETISEIYKEDLAELSCQDFAVARCTVEAHA
ncbi:hypothetical protein [Streptomyces sp. NPDC057686]|uniref:hypothetical protein n=1 Tax=Streptomyces sp. NPDC057686 TaxID=3346212 RepID=UPI0036933EF1